MLWAPSTGLGGRLGEESLIPGSVDLPIGVRIIGRWRKEPIGRSAFFDGGERRAPRSLHPARSKWRARLRSRSGRDGAASDLENWSTPFLIQPNRPGTRMKTGIGGPFSRVAARRPSSGTVQWLVAWLFLILRTWTSAIRREVRRGAGPLWGRDALRPGGWSLERSSRLVSLALQDRRRWP